MEIEDGLRLLEDKEISLVLVMDRNWLQLTFQNVLMNCRV